MYDLALKNGFVVTDTEVFRSNIYVKDEKIAEISTDDKEAKQVFDVNGKYILPGCIDTHCHFRDPGVTQKEDFTTGTQAAIAGGVTTVFDMPNTNPSVLSAKDLQWKADYFSKKAYADYGIWGLALGKLNLDELPALCASGVSAVKFFWGYAINAKTKALIYNYDPKDTDVILPPGDGEVYELFSEMAKTGKIIAIHAENNELIQTLTDKLKQSGRTDYEALVDSRPALAEALTIQTAALLAKATGAHLHILHLTSKMGVDIIRKAKAEGVHITAETCPQYLFLSSKDYDTVGPMMKVYPVIKHEEDRLALWQGLFDGTVDFMASDHAPHLISEKQGPLFSIPAGMCGVETMLPLMLNEVSRGKITLPFIAKVLAKNAATTYNLKDKGSLTVGKDADMVVVDMQKIDTIENNKLHSKQPLTAFAGREIQGWPIKTFLRGQLVVDNNNIIANAPCGKWIK